MRWPLPETRVRLPTVEAKYELLQYMRRSYAVNNAFREAKQCKTGSELHTAYEVAISSSGALRVMMFPALYPAA